MEDIVSHAKKEKAYENIQPQLASIVHKLLTHYPDFNIIFGMSNFLPLFDLFIGNTQVEVSKSLLEAFSKHKDVTSDPLLINTVFIAAKILHDSVNALSFADEIRQITSLISAFLSKVRGVIEICYCNSTHKPDVSFNTRRWTMEGRLSSILIST